ncbi:chemotaxis protein CheA (plasmid) [Pontibacillus sp. ALD_SL1]|uniref:chemotaxis protein CheA n=1 Tax=Pontibacillus sp. ALD_SL1 TaxID=2777185 RepID=UPI001A95FDB3|nr:chemotaxis protein CheA [Pontibacillus sp. ALD_SL1]QST03056.1 chemotaxis protein CheA [Pontibacillus sp. ALD_SL1]
MDKDMIVQIFLEEIFENLHDFSDILLQLEQDPTNVEHIQSLFRCVHTMKGSSSTTYNMIIDQSPEDPSLPTLHDMSDLTHNLENLISDARDEKISLHKYHIDLFFECEYTLGQLAKLIRGDHDDLVSTDPLLQKLSNSQLAKTPASSPSKDPTPLESFLITMEESDFKHAYLSLLYRELEDQYNVISMKPTYEEIINGENFAHAIVSIGEVENVDDMVAFISSRDNVLRVEHKPNEKGADTQTEIKEEPSVSTNSTIKVAVSRIDDVLKHVSNIVILKNKLLNSVSDSDDTTSKLIRDAAHEISQTVEYLKDSVMSIRMTKLDHLFGRFPSDVRRTANELNKKIAFTYDGGETEIDKSLLDELGNPLTHLIRNSVSHGIEDRETRLANGKSETGNITLSARHEQNRVMITVKDDGGGIDLEAVTQKAIKNGVITADEASKMSAKEQTELIFHQGVSTAKNVTGISGRGVGMDAVRTAIEEMNGHLEINTKKGEGTKIVIVLPLTLAIVKALLVRLDNEIYAIPSSQIDLNIEIHSEEIKYVANKEVVVQKEREMPIVRLRNFFNLPPDPIDEKKMKLVIVRSGNRSVAVKVDEFMHYEDIVVKHIGETFGHIPGISGCNLLGTGDISLIIDVNGILTQTEKRG